MKSINASLVFSILIIGAFLLAVAQPFGLSPDYSNYEIFFQQARLDFATGIDNRFEPGFVLVAGVLASILSSDLVVYGVFVVISIACKLFLMERFTTQPQSRANYYLYLACFFYSFRYLPLHELTQLRASLGISVVFVACFFIWRGQRLRGVAITGLAACFHYSSLMVAPLLFLRSMGRRTVVILSVSIFVVLHFVWANAISLAQAYFVVFESYDTPFREDAVNPLSPVFFPEFFLLASSMVYWRHMNEVMRRIVTLQMIGFALFYGLIDFPVVAVRGREFISALWTLFIVQSAMMPLKFRCLLHAFVAFSLALSLYQYLVLDFFTR